MTAIYNNIMIQGISGNFLTEFVDRSRISSGIGHMNPHVAAGFVAAEALDAVIVDCLNH